MDKIQRIKDLIEILNEASDAYYNTSNTLISDQQWDNTYDALSKLENETGVIYSNSPTQKVGYTVLSKLPKVKHEIPLLSLDKTKLIPDIKKFIGSNESLCSLKADGLTIELVYQNGTLMEGSTRGDGVEGELITHNAKVFRNIPTQIPFKGELKLSGEAVIHKYDFDKINAAIPNEEDRYKNARNLVAGSVRQLESKNCAERNVYFYSFNLLKVNGVDFNKKSDQLEFLRSQGFKVIPYFVADKDNIEDIIDELREIAGEISIGIDGMVITYNDIAYSKSLGFTSKFPKDSIAFKFYDERTETTFTGIEWAVSRTGQINPTGLFLQVIIDGTEVSRATLHNLEYIESLQLGIGDTIEVTKRNQIIPKIEENLTRSNTITIPTECPSCGHSAIVGTLEKANVLFCSNDSCRGKLVDKISHFVSKKALNIDGFSEKTVEKFIEIGYIEDYIDIFNLENYKKEITNLPGFGKKSYDNLIEAINTARETELHRLVYGLGINHVGENSSKKLCKHFGNDIKRIIASSYDELMFIDDFGHETSNAVEKFFWDNYKMVNELVNELKIVSNNNVAQGNILNNATFVITGKLSKSRDEFKALIESLGGVVQGSVSNKTTYLLAGENTGATKVTKAEKCGTKVINEEEFMEMIK